MTTRYAIYYVPAPENPLWRFGCEVLGYDAYTGGNVEQWRPDGIPADDWRGMTADPRLYGFHATLKAPFRPRDGVDEAALVASLKTFATSHRVVEAGEWLVKPIGSSLPGKAFLALVPAAPSPALAALESAIVRYFDAFRAPLTEAEIARRNPARLNQRQRAYLDSYGYPHVLEEFRFHMTLTGAIDHAASIGAALAAEARRRLAVPSLHVDRLGLFKQDDGGPFRVVSTETLA